MRVRAHVHYMCSSAGSLAVTLVAAARKYVGGLWPLWLWFNRAREREECLVRGKMADWHAQTDAGQQERGARREGKGDDGLMWRWRKSNARETADHFDDQKDERHPIGGDVLCARIGRALGESIRIHQSTKQRSCG